MLMLLSCTSETIYSPEFKVGDCVLPVDKDWDPPTPVGEPGKIIAISNKNVSGSYFKYMIDVKNHYYVYTQYELIKHKCD
jgi:hypothetical protein